MSSNQHSFRPLPRPQALWAPLYRFKWRQIHPDARPSRFNEGDSMWIPDGSGRLQGGRKRLQNSQKKSRDQTPLQLKKGTDYLRYVSLQRHEPPKKTQYDLRTAQNGCKNVPRRSQRSPTEPHGSSRLIEKSPLTGLQEDNQARFTYTCLQSPSRTLPKAQPRLCGLRRKHSAFRQRFLIKDDATIVPQSFRINI